MQEFKSFISFFSIGAVTVNVPTQSNDMPVSSDIKEFIMFVCKTIIAGAISFLVAHYTKKNKEKKNINPNLKDEQGR
jgi:uncharacterized membrane protein